MIDGSDNRVTVNFLNNIIIIVSIVRIDGAGNNRATVNFLNNIIIIVSIVMIGGSFKCVR